MEREAQARKEKAKVLDLVHIKEFSVSLGDVREKRDAHGRMEKVVRLLNCRARLARLGVVEHQSEMEAGEGYGVLGEVNQCLSPGLKEFLLKIEKAVLDAANAENQKLNTTPDGMLVLPSDRPKDPHRSERMKALNAARNAARAAGDTPAAAPEPAVAPEGGAH